jgi:hypothetical protein
VEEQTKRLLSAIWGNREGYVFLPFKENGKWHETPGLHLNGSFPNVSEIVDRRGDVYFCPVVFSKPKRKKEFAKPTNLLWADLDPVHPGKCRLRPSIAWESSPGRYQALWFLTSELPPEEASELSRRIAYADGADRSGWDLGQVLRIPGTRNYKYPSNPPVKLLWAKRSINYAPDEIRSAYPPVESEDDGRTLSDAESWPEVTESEVNAAFGALPHGFQVRIVRPIEGADRSLELQKLARDLLRHGLTPDVVAHLLKMSGYNKFRGRTDEKQQLLKQVRAATQVIGERLKAQPLPQELTLDANQPLEQMEVHTWGDFLSVPTQLKWLVEDSWVDESVGFISGRSKSYKTWIALDLGLSVVSGKPFLDQFLVGRTGPVILVQEEDPMPVLQERLRLIGKRKGMLPSVDVLYSPDRLRLDFPDYPLHIINLQGFNLGSTDKVAQVRQLIAEVNPIMVILDPLVVMLGGVDEFRASEVSNLLQVIKFWREEYRCSVVVVHHWNKTKNDDGDRGGQHMYGSFAFHAWLESALHVQPVIDEVEDAIDTVIIEREFKAAPSGRALKVKFEIDSAEKYTYEPIIETSTDSPLMVRCLDIILQSPGITLPELTTMTGNTRPRVSEAVSKLVRAKKVEVQRGGGRGKSSKIWPYGEKPAEAPA